MKIFFRRWKRMRTFGSLHVCIDYPDGPMVVFTHSSPPVCGWAFDAATGTSVPVRIRIGKRVFSAMPAPRTDVRRAFAAMGCVSQDIGFMIPYQPSRGLRRPRIEVFIESSGWLTVHRFWTWRPPRIFRSRRRQPIPPPHPLPQASHHDMVVMAATRHREERAEVDRHIEVMPIRPRFSVLIDLRQAAAGLLQTLESLALQTYPPHEIRRLGGNGAACNGLAELSAGDPADLTGDFVIVLRPGECFAERAIYELASEVNRDPACDVLYADEDVVDAAGLHVQPFYKPAWSPDYLELFCYLGFPVAVRLDGLRRCFAGWDAYDMLLRMTEATDRVSHVPQVLGHARAESALSSSRSPPEHELAALAGRLERTGRFGSVRPHPTQTNCYAICPSLTNRPTVSVVISMVGKVIHLEDGRRFDLVFNLVKQIRDCTDYRPVEIIVVDNNDLSEEQRAVLEAHECRRVTSNSCVFNVARKRNLGASVSTGDLLLFLNDDIEVLQPAWLTHMVAHFEKPQLGVLGVKLLDRDRRIQHVGVVLNSGNPDHVLRSFPGDDPGYFHSGCGPRNFLAVTGAAMMTRRDTFARVGGYSEELAVSFNDIDFCLKVRQLGLNVACDSSIELIHLESQSRLPELDRADFSLFSTRWAAAIIRDPFYNELRLTVAPPTFSPQGNRRLL